MTLLIVQTMSRLLICFLFVRIWINQPYRLKRINQKVFGHFVNKIVLAHEILINPCLLSSFLCDLTSCDRKLVEPYLNYFLTLLLSVQDVPREHLPPLEKGYCVSFTAFFDVFSEGMNFDMLRYKHELLAKF